MGEGLKLSSDFLILDVKRGRKKLSKHISNGGKVRVRIEVEINTQHSADDGVSIEFSGEVLSLEQIA